LIKRFNTKDNSTQFIGQSDFSYNRSIYLGIIFGSYVAGTLDGAGNGYYVSIAVDSSNTTN